jgi:hypothetical protein
MKLTCKEEFYLEEDDKRCFQESVRESQCH